MRLRRGFKFLGGNCRLSLANVYGCQLRTWLEKTTERLLAGLLLHFLFYVSEEPTDSV